MLGGRDRRSAGAREYDFDLGDFFLDEEQRVEERRAGDDRRAVLIVVENRDGERLAQPLLDVEAIR